jgi:hypothetical protein
MAGEVTDMEEKLEVIAEKTEAHCLELVRREFKDSHFIVKFDGCIHMSTYCNGDRYDDNPSPENTDYLHICDLDDMISLLQEVRAKAKAHFGKDWPN